MERHPERFPSCAGVLSHEPPELLRTLACDIDATRRSIRLRYRGVRYMRELSVRLNSHVNRLRRYARTIACVAGSMQGNAPASSARRYQRRWAESGRARSSVHRASPSSGAAWNSAVQELGGHPQYRVARLAQAHQCERARKALGRIRRVPAALALGWAPLSDAAPPINGCLPSSRRVHVIANPRSRRVLSALLKTTGAEQLRFHEGPVEPSAPRKGQPL